FDGHLIAFDLTGGEKGDAPHFPILLGLGPDVDPRAAVADKGYASKANRQAARSRGIIPVIPRKANEKGKPGFFAKAIYKGRARIERAVGKLKRFSVSSHDARRRSGTSHPSSHSQPVSPGSNPSTLNKSKSNSNLCLLQSGREVYHNFGFLSHWKQHQCAKTYRRLHGPEGESSLDKACRRDWINDTTSDTGQYKRAYRR